MGLGCLEVCALVSKFGGGCVGKCRSWRFAFFLRLRALRVWGSRLLAKQSGLRVSLARGSGLRDNQRFEEL